MTRGGAGAVMCSFPRINGVYACENPAMSWNFQVRHYGDEQQQARDPKYIDGGVLYPRAATLGGCTAHNAMITITPQDRDWDAIATFTQDNSWRADKVSLLQVTSS